MNSLLVRAKKSPEESKITRLMTQNGWTLMGGDNVWLIFQKKGIKGEFTVTRATKEWYFDHPETSGNIEVTGPEGRGLDSLAKAVALPQFQSARAMSAGAASTAVNNAAKGRPGSGHDQGLEDLLSKRGTCPSGNPQLGDVAVVMKYLQEHGPTLPQELTKVFGWKPEQAYGILKMLKDEGRLGQKQMRFYLKQASRFKFKSKVLYRESRPINVFQRENKEIVEGSGQASDGISRKSLGDYPRLRKSR